MLISAAPLRGAAQTSSAAPQPAAKTPAAAAPQPYHVVKTIPLSFNPPAGSALAFDPASRRLFVPADKVVYVVNIDSGAIVGKIRKVGSLSELALAPEINRGFGVDSWGHLVIFDLQNYAVLTRAGAGVAERPVTRGPETDRGRRQNRGIRLAHRDACLQTARRRHS